MKRISLTVKPYLVDQFIADLASNGISDAIVTDVKEHRFDRGGVREASRGAEYIVNFVPRTKIEIFVDDQECPSIVKWLALRCKQSSATDKILTEPVETFLAV